MRNILLGIKKQKQRAWRNFLALAIVQVSNYVLPLVSLPYLARTVGSEGLGLVALSLALMLYFSTIVDYGFDYTAVRDVAIKQNDTSYVSTVFWEVLFCKLFLLSLSFFIFLILILSVPAFQQHKLFFFYAFLSVPLKMLIHEWYFQGMERMKIVALFSFFTKLLYTIAIFTIIKNKSDLYIVPLLNAFSYSLAAITVTFILIKKGIYYPIKKPKPTNIIYRLRSGFDMFLSQIIPNLYNSFSVILLSLVAPLYLVGHLDVARKFISAFEQFANLLSRAFFPFMSRNLSYHKRFLYICLLYSAGVISLTIFLSDYFILLLFGQEFSDSATYAKLLSISALFLILYRVFSTNYLVLVGKDKAVRNITLIAASIGFISSFYLIPKYSVYGAIAVIIIARFIMAASAIFVGLKVRNEIKN